MEKFDYIGDIILKVDEGKIVKKKKSPVKPLGLLIVGAAVLYFGSTHINAAENDILSSVAIMIGLGIIGWGVVAFLVKKENYIYSPTGKVLKKHKVYLSPNQSSKLYQILEEDKFDDLQVLNRTNQSNLSLEIFSTDDEEYALVQALEFIPYNDVPTSPVKICSGTRAKQIAYFLK
ncbi:hypothetical protein [uncultured Sanguibacteroides sp.]|uniref:hypothetical protein n=1 Tax=uncultured Sanguibacteroides sp. TaxID=1635151 RepID=UPI0025D13A57|nr:hypothetical protein [uncultured Sanguibacteroides sp.]